MGEVIGVPAFGLRAGGDWAKVDGHGREGSAQAEERTAKALDAIARAERGPTVLHDLKVPGSPANIDHVLVWGTRVLIIDTKWWKPGIYWTLAGRSHRGLTREEKAEKRGMVAARAALARHLSARGLSADVAEPLLLVWPSRSSEQIHLRLLRVPGARAVPAERGLARLRRTTDGAPAARAVVDALVPLVNSLAAEPSSVSTTSPAMSAADFLSGRDGAAAPTRAFIDLDD